MIKAKTRIVELDALRGIAAFSVMLFHFSKMANPNDLFFRWGVTGVDLFFLISGFVIYMTLEKNTGLRSFVVSRFSRLFPTYIVMLAITTCAIIIFDRGRTPGVKTILGNLTMLQPVFNIPYIDDSYWTLTVELLFYILMGFLLVSKMLARIEWAGTWLLLIFFVYYLIAANYFSTSKIYIIPRSIIPLISHFQLFFAGILFYKIKTGNSSIKKHLLIWACFLVNLYMFDKSGRSHFAITITEYIPIMGFYFLLFYLFTYQKLGFLDVPVLVFLGNISYSLYLVHQEAGSLLYNYLHSSFSLAPLLIFVLLTILMITVAALVTYYIERPAIKYIRAKWLTSQQGKPAASML